MDKYLPAVQQMNELNNTLHMILIAVAGGAVTLIGVVVAQAKIFLPRTLKRRDEQRKIELEAMRQEFETKHAAQAVEIERDRMLPLAFESNQRLVDAMIKSKEADTAATLQRIELDKTTAAVLVANTKQITTHSDRIEENTNELKEVKDAVNKVNDAIADMKTVLPTLARKSEMDLLIGRVDGVIHNLEELKRDCIQKKHDSKELPLVTLPPPPANVLYDNVLPEDLEPTG